MTTPDVPAPAGPSHPKPLAEWVDRVVAALIDGLFIWGAFVVVWILSLIVGAVSDALAVLILFAGWLALSGATLYFGYMEGTGGQSPGKRIRGLKIVDMNGQLIGGGMGVVRKIAHVVDGICFIGYLLPLFDDKKQTFADKIVQTVSIKDQDTQPFSLNIFKPDQTTPAAPPGTPEA